MKLADISFHALVCALLTSVLLFAGESFADTNNKSIPVIGLDDQGNEISYPVKVPYFKNRLKKAYRSVNQTSLQALPKMRGENRSWKLSSVEIGVSLFASIGLGSVIQASAEPTLLFVFKRSSRGLQ